MNLLTELHGIFEWISYRVEPKRQKSNEDNIQLW